MTRTLLILLAMTVSCGSGNNTGDDADADTFSDTGDDEQEAGENWISLDFSLAEQSVVVNNSVGYTAEIVAESGARLTTVVEISSDMESELAHSSEELTPTVLGSHTLTATATHEGTDLSAEASLEVTLGEPASIELTLSDMEPEVDQYVTATAIIHDEQGHELDVPWTLSVTAEPDYDESSVEIDDLTLHFTAEGWFTVVATVDSNGVSDSVGPLPVDSFPPTIDITNPERGAWREDADDIVTGTITDAVSDIESATINGHQVELDYRGEFSYDIIYDFGISMLETIAEDEDGMMTTDRRSVLHGDFIPRKNGVGEGMVARINQAALDVIIEEVLGGASLINVMFPVTIVDLDDEECIDLGFEIICITLYQLVLELTDVRTGSYDVTIDPTDEGSIVVSVIVNDIEIDWSASAILLETENYDETGTITSDYLSLSVALTPYIEDGQIRVNVSDIGVGSSLYQFDFPDWLLEVADIFGVDPNQLIEDFISAQIEAVVVDPITAIIEEALQDLELSTSFEIQDNTYSLHAQPDSIGVDDNGITLAMKTTFDPEVWLLDVEGLGSLYHEYSMPTYGATPDMELSMSLNFFNQVLYALWGGGMLNIETNAESLGFNPALLGLLFEELAAVENIVVEPLLPPVMLPGDDDHLMELQIGDLKVYMYGDDPTDPDDLLLGMYVGLTANVDLKSDGASIALEVDGLVPWLDITEPIRADDFEVSTEELLGELLPMLVNQIIGALGEIPVPNMTAFGLTNVTVDSDGSDRGYISISGDLEPSPSP